MPTNTSPSMNKLAFLTIAAASNAVLFLVAGALSRSLRLDGRLLLVYLVAVIVVWFGVFSVMAFWGTPASLTPRKRAVTALRESTLSTVIFCAVLLGYGLLGIRHLY
jgi:hypothetical protein